MTGKRHVLRAVWRGLRGRCPACGRGRALQGYASPLPHCAACGEDLAPYKTADFAPYLVTFFVGLTFVPLTVKLAMSGQLGDVGVWPLMAAAFVVALVMLPRMKGAALGLLWALDVCS